MLFFYYFRDRAISSLVNEALPAFSTFKNLLWEGFLFATTVAKKLFRVKREVFFRALRAKASF